MWYSLITQAINTLVEKKTIGPSTKREAIRFLRYIESSMDRTIPENDELYHRYYKYLRERKIIL